MTSQRKPDTKQQPEMEPDAWSGVSVFFEPRQDDQEMKLLASMNDILHSMNMLFVYQEFGHIILYKVDGSTVSDLEWNVIEHWLLNRSDIQDFDVKPLPVDITRKVYAVEPSGSSRHVLLEIKPRLH